MTGLIWIIALSFFVTIIIGPVLIPFLHKLKFGQTVRDDGPESHFKKTGTPTMGGILFVIGTVVAIVQARHFDVDMAAALLLFLGYGALGFADDFIKVVLRRNLGLRAKQKLIGQLLIAVVFVYLTDKFTGNVNVPLLNYSIDLGYWYAPFVIFILIGTSNAVNLTDGLDGLAAGVTFIVLLAYTFIAFMFDKTSLAIFSAALAGGCMGFLMFNFNPAKIFMGDTGSLALGGAVAALAVLTNTELALPFIGAVYVIETLSVILQVISFKTTGKRIFKMSPIHHHFELTGWSEVKVVTIFYLWAVIFTVIGVYILSV